MKKRTSIASLTLTMTWIPAALITLLTPALQLFLCQPMHDSQNRYIYLLEQQLDSTVARLGSIGFLLLALAVIGCCSSQKRSDFGMTLRRMGVSPLECRVLIGLVFFGYFLIYWAVQFLTVTALYARTKPFLGEEPLIYFMTTYRSNYFHLLMPLRDIWGYIRNVTLCLCFGMMCTLALGRPGQKVLSMIWLPILVWLALHLVTGIGHATITTDIALSITAVGVTSLSVWGTARRLSHENI